MKFMINKLQKFILYFIFKFKFCHFTNVCTVYRQHSSTYVSMMSNNKYYIISLFLSLNVQCARSLRILKAQINTFMKLFNVINCIVF